MHAISDITINNNNYQGFLFKFTAAIINQNIVPRGQIEKPMSNVAILRIVQSFWFFIEGNPASPTSQTLPNFPLMWPTHSYCSSRGIILLDGWRERPKIYRNFPVYSNILLLMPSENSKNFPRGSYLWQNIVYRFANTWYFQETPDWVLQQLSSPLSSTLSQGLSESLPNVSYWKQDIYGGHDRTNLSIVWSSYLFLTICWLFSSADDDTFPFFREYTLKVRSESNGISKKRVGRKSCPARTLLNESASSADKQHCSIAGETSCQ